MIDEQGTSDVRSLRIEPAHSAVSRVHRQVRGFLDRLEVAAPLAADVELVVAELASNAVDHGPNRPIELELLLFDDAVYLTVSNGRTARQEHVLPTEANADPLTDRGRGLAIVHALVDGMWVHGRRDSMSVTCLWRKDR